MAAVSWALTVGAPQDICSGEGAPICTSACAAWSPTAFPSSPLLAHSALKFVFNSPWQGGRVVGLALALGAVGSCEPTEIYCSHLWEGWTPLSTAAVDYATPHQRRGAKAALGISMPGTVDLWLHALLSRFLGSRRVRATTITTAALLVDCPECPALLLTQSSSFDESIETCACPARGQTH